VLYLVSSVVFDEDSVELKAEVAKELKAENAMKAFEKFLNLSDSSAPRIIQADGSVDKRALDDIFTSFDVDNSGCLDSKEVEQLMNVMFRELQQTPDGSHFGTMHKKLKAAQDQKNKSILKRSDIESPAGVCVPKKKQPKEQVGIEQDVFVEIVSEHLEVTLAAVEQARLSAEAMLEHDENSEEAGLEGVMSVPAAIASIFLGTTLVILFSDGVVTAIDTFATKTSIPNFVVGFVVVPLASNASELVSSLQFAGAKKQKNISVTFSQIYAAVTLNNTLCLGVLLIMVYIRGLKWDYTAEVACILFATWAVGAGTCGTTIKYGFALFALAVYPISLGLVEGMHASGIS